jgi:hypothetical protein
MERDAEAVQQMFIDLVRQFELMGPSPEANPDDRREGPIGNRTAGRSAADYLPHAPRPDQSTRPQTHSQQYPLTSGDIPAVQDRFYTLLKNRLQSEIQRQPPLFPWEQEISEYQTEARLADFALPVIRLGSPWLAQLRRLTLPVALPDAVLAQLLSQCQTLANASVREGVKLVKAVETLFPGELATLNQLAGLVMLSPARGAATLQDRLAETTGGELPTSYEAAQPNQQMVLSLLAAREILEALTLPVSAQPTEYEWVTASGVLTLQTEYVATDDGATLRVRGQFPSAAGLELRSVTGTSGADRDTEGSLSVSLSGLPLAQPCLLEVRLGDSDAVVFTLVPAV